ncbi:NAD-dependent epimerase/dehydratase family protein [Clostridium sp.]|uniref:NAD-dependent epimerase/dehydratase family protein n=1 Tax=Clostridium sp. TaxID=1506 RepID=UPI00283EF9E6|nr:NAD-dependent epimerase/dehydratase family protein [Clostridium sp.]MDR3596097.1 NAD-dependent epimerase/dehydratase family protein [Clostridium sp.]
MKKKCILFGGAGFIGKNLALLLKAQGYDITIYDLYIKKAFSSEDLQKFKIIEKDFFQDNELEKSITGNDVIIHLISSVNPAKSMIEPSKCYNNDLVKTIELLDVARKNNINKVVFISSGGTVYGNYEANSYSEEMPNNPINHYGIMKLAIEKIMLMYNQLYNMNNVILRVSNPYGKGQNPNNNLGAISVFTQKILNGNTIQIYGDGEIVRDYIYIDDVVNAIEKAINYKVHNDVMPIFNVGSGIGTTLNQLLRYISSILDKEYKVEYVKSRGIDVHRSVLNMEKSKSELEVEIKHSIKEGIASYIASK